jgi:glycolate oxidase iron-sulfur subunit
MSAPIDPTGELRALASDCVHCGFCLPACPTYVLRGEEADSPRGRIDLVAQGLAGEPLSGAMLTHLDRCLGCLACVPACPSGVRYDLILADTRAQLERRATRGRWERLLRAGIFATFPYPRRLRALKGPLWLYQRTGLQRLAVPVTRRLPASLRTVEGLAPRVRFGRRLPRRIPATGPRRAVVGLLTGCVQGALLPHVGAATARVLAAEGCDVVVPRGQGCCGALASHSGREAQAVRLARRTIATFERAGVDAVVVDAAGCGSAMKEYAYLLRDDPAWAERAERLPVRDVTEWLVELGPVAERHPLDATVAYHDACHLAHAQRIREQPRELLRGVPGLTVRELAGADLCCGSAGVYNLLEPDTAAQLGDRKAAAVLATDADMVVTANPGCLLQIGAALARAGRPMPVRHVVEVLAKSVAPGPTR